MINCPKCGAYAADKHRIGCPEAPTPSPAVPAEQLGFTVSNSLGSLDTWLGEGDWNVRIDGNKFHFCLEEAISEPVVPTSTTTY